MEQQQEKTALVTIDERAALRASSLSQMDDMWINPLMFEQGQRAAAMLSTSIAVPDVFKGKVADCFAVLAMSRDTGMKVFQAFQALYSVHGRIGWYSKALIAQANASGKLKSSIKYRMTGERGKDTWGCIAYATMHDGEVAEGTEVTMAMAKGEGWVGKSGSKWQTMPELMLKYRAASFFISQHCPEVQYGLPTKEELDDIGPTPSEQATTPMAIDLKKEAEVELANLARAKADFQKVAAGFDRERLLQLVGTCGIIDESVDEIYNMIDVLRDASAASSQPADGGDLKKGRGRGRSAAVPPPPPPSHDPSTQDGGSELSLPDETRTVAPSAVGTPAPAFLKPQRVIDTLLEDKRISVETRGRLEALRGRQLKEADDVLIARGTRLGEQGKFEELDSLLKNRPAL